MLSESERAVLAARLRRGKSGNPAAARRITRRPPDLANPPASFGQEQLWFIDRLAPDRAIYNLPCLIRLRGPLDTEALRRALGALAARHEALRTRLAADAAGRPVQLIDPPRAAALDVIDLSGLEPAARHARLSAFIRTESARPFDLAAGPLLRTWLVRLAETEHVLTAIIHHAVFDGWSAGLLRHDLAVLYQAQAGGETITLPELPVQFADYALWERDRAGGEELAELEDYWREVMAGFETVQFPADRPRPVLDDFSGALAQRLTDRKLLAGLRELSRAEGATMFATVLAALTALLHRYTGQADLVVGTVSANRGKATLTPLIGFLVNTLPIRVDASGDPPFTELLRRVRESTVAAFGHQDLPFGRLVEALRVERDPSRAPVFQIAMTYAERDAGPVVAGGVEFAASEVPGTEAAKFDLAVVAEARAEGLWFECSYKTALFDAATAERLLAHLEVLLRGVVADPSALVSRLPLLTGAELRAELADWNDTAGPVPACRVHERFEEQARRTPDAPAAEFEGQVLTYAGLNARASQIARQLRGLGTGPEVLAGVCMRAGLGRLAGLLGIWKAGGGYVPLDPALPPERLAFLVRDTGMTVVLTDQASRASLPDPGGATVLSLDAGRDQLHDPDGGDPAGTAACGNPAGTAACPRNVAYVLYTSGSTGQPKGVAVEHRQAVNLLAGMAAHWAIGPSDVALQFAALTFDVSVMDTFMPLLTGARVVLAPAETLHSPPRLARLIHQARVTFAFLSPAVLSLLGQEQFGHLRILVVGGEELPSELARHWIRPGLRLVNGYGPTEATVIATHAELDAGTPLPPPIGFPTPGSRVYVLDEHLNPVPVGVTGELHIGGAGVGRGYLHRPGLTGQRFIADPFRPGGRLYRTGDLVRRRPDGSIVFLGRSDTQVKVRGLRIELGEIEAALASHPAVAQAVATVVTDPAGDKQLAGYLRTRPGTAAPGTAELRDHLARTLPAHLVPAYLITVGEFPLSSSGKIDRPKLPLPQALPTAAGEAPGTPTESMLAGLYAAVLGTGQVGAGAGFFDLGGNSLQAMRLIDMIHRETGVDLSVTAVFLYPTVRELAARIDAAAKGGAGGAAAGAGPLVELSTGVGEVPLFLIHPVGGTVSAYAHLAQELAGEFRVYGLQAPALTGDGATPASLDALVADYAQRIRAACPDRPCAVAGWSMGGAVAFGIAQRLERDGAQVALLVLLDAPFRVPARDVPGAGQLAGRFVADAVRSLGRETAAAPDPVTATVDEQLGWLAGRLGAGVAERAGTGEAGGKGGVGEVAGVDGVSVQLRRRFEVFGAHHQMLAGYQPAGPAVRVPALIVSAGGSPNAAAGDQWPGMLAGPVSTLRIDSDHYAFLRPPLVADVATSILKWDGTA